MIETMQPKEKKANGQQPVPVPAAYPFGWLREEMESMFNKFLTRWPVPFEPVRGFEAFWGMDLEDAEKEVVVRAEVPGFEPAEFEIKVTGNVLKIKAEHKAEEKKEGRTWQRYHGKFERLVTLPEGVAAEKAEAFYRNGVLEVRLPKTAEVLPKQIPVKA